MPLIEKESVRSFYCAVAIGLCRQVLLAAQVVIYRIIFQLAIAEFYSGLTRIADEYR